MYDHCQQFPILGDWSLFTGGRLSHCFSEGNKTWRAGRSPEKN